MHGILAARGYGLIWAAAHRIIHSLCIAAALLRKAAKQGKYGDVFSLLEEHRSIRIDAVRIGGSGKTALCIAAERGCLHVRC